MEGPSVHRVADELERFEGQTVVRAGGNADQPLERLEGRSIDAVRAVKKRLFLDLDPLHVVVHFLLYGSYRVNEARDLDERLSLECDRDSVNVYSCSVKVLEDGDAELAEYDRPVADVLLDQSIFGGVGNIVKNEVLRITRIHPEAPGTALDAEAAAALTTEAVDWTAHWYRTKRDGGDLGLSVYRMDACPACDSALERAELGEYDRITYWCPTCQSRPDS